MTTKKAGRGRRCLPGFPASLLALAVAFAVTPAEADPREIRIRDAALLVDADARERLTYLASCALDADTVLVGEIDGVRHTFQGDMALAPTWADRPMTRSERRWVSACILARTNKFGTKVRISLRAPRPDVPVLSATPEEILSHPHHEGGYFGDVFATPPVAFVCIAADKTIERRHAEARLSRVCSHPSGPPAPNGETVSECGFTIVEDCGSKSVWPETIDVYLP